MAKCRCIPGKKGKCKKRKLAKRKSKRKARR